MSSSVNPTDSASTVSKGKARPGKRERLAKREAASGSQGANASASKAAMFAAGAAADPVPQPGRYPVIFNTGAGEPSRDQDFVLPVHELAAMLINFPSKYTRNDRYAEFRTNADISDVDFGRQMSMSFLLRLAQQVVHAHSNMGLPQGDFAPVASSDVRIPAALAAVAGQFGEFSVPSIGTRFLLRDYAATVAQLVRTAQQVTNGDPPRRVFQRAWLPVHQEDKSFKALVVARLNQLLAAAAGVTIDPTELEDSVMSGDVPESWLGVTQWLGVPPAEGQRDQRSRFNFLFKRFSTEETFLAAYTAAGNYQALEELGLVWEEPRQGHLQWQLDVKRRFSSLADNWAKLSASYAKFFELSSGLSNRSAAVGTTAQMAQVSTTEAVTVVRTMLALSPPEFSLAAAFPPSCVFVGDIPRRVVVTTPLSVSQRATEFCQMDWR